MALPRRKGVERMTFHRRKKQVAKKDHRCDFCGEKISIKERYIYTAAFWDGDFYTMKMHDICDQKLDYTLRKEDAYGEFDLHEIIDIFNENYSEEFGRQNETD